MSTRYQASSRVILTETQDGGGVLLDLDTKFYFTLNTTGVSLWKHLVKSPSSPDTLAQAIVDEFEITLDVAATDVATVLRSLVDEGLVTMGTAPAK